LRCWRDLSDAHEHADQAPPTGDLVAHHGSWAAAGENETHFDVLGLRVHGCSRAHAFHFWTNELHLGEGEITDGHGHIDRVVDVNGDGILDLVTLYAVEGEHGSMGHSQYLVVWLSPTTDTIDSGFTYWVESVSDTEFTKEMDRLGTAGWEAGFARRAKDSDSDKFEYEMIFKRHCGLFWTVAHAADTTVANALRPTAFPGERRP
jgi:hypothetical protein